jgi:hypothetical protein
MFVYLIYQLFNLIHQYFSSKYFIVVFSKHNTSQEGKCVHYSNKILDNNETESDNYVLVRIQ